MKRRVGLKRTGFSRTPRHRMSATEEVLWARLSAAPPGASFRSQMPVRHLVADFGSYTAKVIVEVDGGPHDTRRGDTHARTTAFEAAGYLVLRFGEDEVLRDVDAVVDAIAGAMKVWNGEAR
jgi:very-short-patch-repair endonuclease